MKVDAKLDKETGKKMVSTFLRAGEKGICVIKVIHFLFRSKDHSVWRNTTSCLVWAASPSATRARPSATVR